jgi:hypothetical protein
MDKFDFVNGCIMGELNIVYERWELSARTSVHSHLYGGKYVLDHVDTGVYNDSNYTKHVPLIYI